MAGSPTCGGYRVCRTVPAAGSDIEPETLRACRALASKEAGAQWGAQGGVSALSQLFVDRYPGHSAEAAGEWFVALWQHLRPELLGRPAQTPRTWNT